MGSPTVSGARGFDSFLAHTTTNSNMPKPPKPPAPGTDLQDAPPERQYVINTAHLKDIYCHYSFKVIDGIETGGEHSVKIDNEVTDDLIKAFNQLNVHLAFIDDVFKHAGIEVVDLDRYHGDPLTMLYSVSGFKITGDEGDETVVLSGSKYVSLGGRINIQTPKITLDENSSYKWYNEMRDAIATARREVSLYREGKFIAHKDEEDKPNPKQMKIDAMISKDVESADSVDFNSAKV